MRRRTLGFCLTILGTLLATPAGGNDHDLASFSEEILVLDELPFIQQLAEGQSVRIKFGVGELEIEAADTNEIRTEVDVDCKKLDAARCERYAKKLRLEARPVGDFVEVRLRGLRRSQRRKLGVEGKIMVPRWAPLEVRVGVGHVEIRPGSEDLKVNMGIGDLVVRAAKEHVAAVKVRTRIGDASIRGDRGEGHGRRPMMIGAKAEWTGGDGDAAIDVGLRIGNAEVRLE